MNNKHQLKVGDKVVDLGQVYRIYKIKKDRNLEGEKEDYICYKPYFKSAKNQSLVCSIPKSNVEEANLRKPVSKKKIGETLKLLGQKSNSDTTIELTKARGYLRENDPAETARLLKLLWLEKQDEEKELSNSKKKVYQSAMRYLVEEIAVVQNIGLKKAKKKVVRRLKKVCPQKKDEEENKK
jgi:RNA polymerase-interacting CarD/CdnL/TRCF family regulator